MNLKQLTYFVQLAKSKNFTTAAKELFICQSALSKTIKAMEAELDVQLVDRTSRKFQLTSEGKMLYEKGVESLKLINDQLDGLHDCINTKSGKICVGVPPVISTIYFAKIIHLFKKEYPYIDLEIVEEGANTVKEKVDSGEIDIGVVILPFASDHFDIIPVFQSDNVLVVSKEHPLAAQNSVAFRELRNEKFLSLDQSYMLYTRTVELCHMSGFDPNFTVLSSQWDFLAELISLNQGIGILPRPILSRFNSDKIKLLSLKEPTFPWDIALIVRKDKYVSNPIRDFQKFVQRHGNIEE